MSQKIGGSKKDLQHLVYTLGIPFGCHALDLTTDANASTKKGRNNTRSPGDWCPPDWQVLPQE